MSEINLSLCDENHLLQKPLPTALNVVVLGSGGVGKSATTIRYAQNIFVARYDPTIEDSYRVDKNFGKKTVQLEILDTAGTEKFTAMRDLYMKNGQAFVLMFSVIVGSTFRDLEYLIDQIQRVKDISDFPMVIVGNKVDLDPDSPASPSVSPSLSPDDSLQAGTTAERQISKAQGQELATKYNTIYIESSAKTGYNVDLIFVNLINQFLRYHKPEERRRNKKCVIL
eukprot:TRINITY_DN1188_c0_g1_i1.p1 TRINITY_DN1188_c0_g1~~TRINITY_DN1188_c0_g1_i1.p1  ORF type:complete len:226 (-),score=57.56 TRINITY_DN1188_c0_g1_i1:117-794(-)